MSHRSRHVFYQNVTALSYMALGDAAVRLIAISQIIRDYDLDALVVPQANASLRGLWERVFPGRAVSTVPAEYQNGGLSRPTGHDHVYGMAAFNVFESVWWENGFFDTARLRIEPPVIFKCNAAAQSVMIYPKEKTDGNRVYTPDRWHNIAANLRSKSYKINCLGDTLGLEVDATFPATIDGLENCIAASSLAVGGNTGPTWACLMSDIPQVVLESKKSPHGYWNFDRCQRVLTKNVNIVAELDACL